MKKTGEFLRAKRKFYGLTLRDLEKKTGVSNSYIARIENGKSEPTLDVLHRLLKALSTSWLEFTSETGYAEALDPQTLKLIQIFSQLPPEKRDAALKSLQGAERVTTPSKTRKAR